MQGKIIGQMNALGFSAKEEATHFNPGRSKII